MSGDAEQLEQGVHVALDGLDAEEQLGGDLAVRRPARRRGPRAAERQRASQHALLGGESRAAIRGGVVDGRPDRPLRSGDEDEQRPPDLDRVAVVEPPPAAHAPAVDERAVARQPVVDERPRPADPLQHRVRARDLGVPLERDVARRLAPDAQRLGAGPRSTMCWRASLVEVEQERRAAPLGGEPLGQLDGRDGAQAGRQRASRFTTTQSARPGHADLVDLRILHGVAQPQRRARRSLVRGERARPASSRAGSRPRARDAPWTPTTTSGRSFPAMSHDGQRRADRLSRRRPARDSGAEARVTPCSRLVSAYAVDGPPRITVTAAGAVVLAWRADDHVGVAVAVEVGGADGRCRTRRRRSSAPGARLLR